MAKWNPGVAAARMESGSPTTVGAIRHLDIVDGTVFRETLLAHSDLERSYSYDIIESPLPCRNYVSSHRFPADHRRQSHARHLGRQLRLRCLKDETELALVVGEQIYRDAMRGLNSFMKESS